MRNNTILRWAVPAVLVLVAALGVWLVVTGGEDSDGAPVTSGGTDATLPAGDSDRDSVTELAGLDLPPSTADFLSARLDDGSQLDVTLTLDPADEAVFVTGSGLPTPVESERFITHSSPLWELNPDAVIRGTEDTRDEIARRVEFHDEDDRTRVRIVITPAP